MMVRCASVGFGIGQIPWVGDEAAPLGLSLGSSLRFEFRQLSLVLSLGSSFGFELGQLPLG